MISTIRADMKDELRTALESVGLTRREDGIFTIDLGNDFLGWVGLPDAVVDGLTAVSPIIGLRHQETQKLRSTLARRKYHKYIPPHAKISLGFLRPDKAWHEWGFSGDNVQEAARDLAENIDRYGLTFVRQYAELEKFEDMFLNYRFSVAVDQREILPLIRIIRGDLVGAINFVSSCCVSILKEKDPRSESYKNVFAPALIDYVNSLG